MTQCQGCYSWLPSESMPVGHKFCWADKRALDNIYAAALKQDKLLWWKEVRYNDEKRYTLLKRYRELHPAAIGGNTKGERGTGGKRSKNTGVFDIGRYLEETATADEVLRDRIMKPMTKAHFSQTVLTDPELRSIHGFFKSPQQAGDYWEKLKSEKDAIVSKDACGEEQLEITTGYQSIFRGRLSKIKRIQGIAKEMKNPKQEEWDKMHRKLVTDMDLHGKLSDGISLPDVARQMAGSSASSGAFNGIGMGLGDVEDLLPEDDGQEQEEAEGGGESEAVAGSPSGAGTSAVSEAGQSTTSGKGSEKEDWLDDRQVASAIRSANQWQVTMKTRLHGLLAEAKKLRDDTHEHKAEVVLRNELAILQTRMDTVEMVIDPKVTRDGLKQFLAQFTTSAQGSPRKAGPGESDTVSQTALTLGRKPPCPRFSALVSFAEFTGMVEKYYDAQHIIQLKETTEGLKNPKAALSELSGMFSTAIKDCSKAFATLKKQEGVASSKKRQADGGEEARRMKRFRNTGSNIFDLVASSPMSKAVPALSAESGLTDSAEHGHGPWVMAVPEKHEIFQASSAAKKFAESLLQMFVATQDRMKEKAPPRGSKAMVHASDEHAAANALTKLLPSLAEHMIGDEGIGSDDDARRKQFDELYACTAFCIAAGSSSFANEKFFAGCYRLAFQGTRSFVAVHIRTVTSAMKASGNKDLSPVHIKKYMQAGTAESVEAMMQYGPIYHGTVGPRDLFHLPVGYLVCETVSMERPVCGVRVPIFFKQDADEYKYLLQHCEEVGRPIGLLPQIIEIYSEAAPADPSAKDAENKPTAEEDEKKQSAVAAAGAEQPEDG